MSQFNHSKPTKSTYYYPTYSNVASPSYQPSEDERQMVDEYLKKYRSLNSVSSANTVSTADVDSIDRTSVGSLNYMESEDLNTPNYENSLPGSLASLMPISKFSAGLSNLGNTCYMNSILQCIFNTRKLAGYFERGYHLIEGSASPFVEKLVELLATVFTEDVSRNKIVASLEFFKSVLDNTSDQFAGFCQQDSHEFFRFLIEKIHSDLNRAPKKNAGYSEFKPKRKSLPLCQLAAEWKNYSLERDNSIIRDLFGGIQLSELVCLYCQNASYTFEDTLDFSLTLPPISRSGKNQEVPIYTCLSDYTKDEVIEGYSCANCRCKTTAKRRILIWKQPEILVIQLKRFTLDFEGNKIANKRPISFPLYGLNLDPFTHGKSKEKTGKYNLYAIACHTGDLNFGHCTSIIWNEELNTWLYYDDSNITQLSPEKVYQVAQHCQEPYILFYKRV